jgi:hypothetical protein
MLDVYKMLLWYGTQLYTRKQNMEAKVTSNGGSECHLGGAESSSDDDEVCVCHSAIQDSVR